jgi:hypothetical protein
MSRPCDAPNHPAELPVQFGLRGLLILQAVCAVFFGALAVVGVFAVLLAFLGTLVCAYVDVRTENLPLKRFLVDLMGGIVLPCLCLAYDPCIFRTEGILVGYDGSGALRNTLYVAIVFQMIVLLLWLLAGSRIGRLSGVVAGILFCGTLMAAGIGLALLPLSLIGILIFGIGTLGFVPFLTAAIFRRNVAAAAQRARRVCGRRVLRYSYALGAALSVGVPALANWLVGPQLSRILPATPGSWWCPLLRSG